MLFRSSDLDAIADGTVTAALRRWKRPTVRTDGTLTTRIGVLAIESVERIAPADLTDDDAMKAGWSSAADALGSTLLDRDGDLYVIRFHVAGEDPRIALREDVSLTAEQLGEITKRLSRMDQRSQHGPWTRTVLELIETRPGVRAADLAESVGREKLTFKADVRKLKALGLTESLEVGYRLSPRGVAVLSALKSTSTPRSPL